MAQGTTGIIVGKAGYGKVYSGVDGPFGLPIYVTVLLPAPLTPTGLTGVVSVHHTFSDSGTESFYALLRDGRVLVWGREAVAFEASTNCIKLSTSGPFFMTIHADGTLRINNAQTPFGATKIRDAVILNDLTSSRGYAVWAVTKDGRVVAAALPSPNGGNPPSSFPLPQPALTNAVAIAHAKGQVAILLANGEVVFQDGSPANADPSHLSNVKVLLGGGDRIYLQHSNSVLETHGEYGWKVGRQPSGLDLKQVVETESGTQYIYTNGATGYSAVDDPNPTVAEGPPSEFVSWVLALSGPTLSVIQVPEDAPHLVHPLKRRAVAGQDVEIEVDVSGLSPFTFTWLHDGVAVSNSASSTLRIPSFRRDQAGDYILRVCNGVGCTESQPIHIQILEGPLPQTWSVSSTESSGPGTLRELIQDANACGGATIDMTSLQGQLRLLRPLPPVRSNLQILGSGTNALILSAGATNALIVAPSGRCSVANVYFSAASIVNQGVLEIADCVLADSTNRAVDNSGILTLRRTLVSQNSSYTPSYLIYGAGISMSSGELRAYGCAFVGNKATGAPARGSAICIMDGACWLEDCAIFQNEARGLTPDIQNFPFGGAGGDCAGAGIYLLNGSLEMRRCNVTDNRCVGGEGRIAGFTRAASGGSASGGGICFEGGRATLSQCTVARNWVASGGGVGQYGSSGISRGGGISVSNANVQILNCTLSSNRAQGSDSGFQNSFLTGCGFTPGGSALGGGMYVLGGQAALVSCTVAGNEATGSQGSGPNTCVGDSRGIGYGGGIMIGGVIQSGYDPSSCSMLNSIIAGNSSGPRPDAGLADLYGNYVSLGHNLIGNFPDLSRLAIGDIWGLDPGIEPLTLSVNGMLVHRLKASSPAIDAGTVVGAPLDDETGTPRPFARGIDLGAVESQFTSAANPPRILNSSLADQFIALGNHVNLSVAASGARPFNCQWEKDGLILPGETNLSLTISSFTVSQQGSYRLRIKNDAGSIVTAAAHLQARQPDAGELSRIILPTVKDLSHLATGKGMMVGTASMRQRGAAGNAYVQVLVSSTNGEDWGRPWFQPGFSTDRVVYSEGLFLAPLSQYYRPVSLFTNRTIAVSSDGDGWLVRQLDYTNAWTMLIPVPGGFLAAARSCCNTVELIWISTNLSLRVVDIGAGSDVVGGAFASGRYLLWSTDSFLHSSNGIDWQREFVGSPGFLSTRFCREITSWRGEFACLSSLRSGNNSYDIHLSADGLNWRPFSSITNSIRNMVGGRDTLGAIGDAQNNSWLTISSNGSFWVDFKPPQLGPYYQVRDLAYLGGRWIAAMGDKVTLFSANLERPELQIESRGPGSVSIDSGMTPLQFGQSVQLSANSEAWGRFLYWGDWVTNNPRTVVLGSVNRYTAVFEPTVPVETLKVGDVTRTAPIGQPLIMVDGKLQLGSSVSRFRKAQIQLESSIKDAVIAWTLDGSAPEKSATPQPSSLTLYNSTTLRVVAFTPNGQVVEAPALEVTIRPGFHVEIVNPGGGDVRLTPPGGDYDMGTEVRVEAIPWNAPLGSWRFMGWADAGYPPETSLVLKMDRNYELHSIFGSTLSVGSSSLGNIETSPSGSVFAYGSTVKLTATPASGYSFGFWYSPQSYPPNWTQNPLRLVIQEGVGDYVSAAFLLGQGGGSIIPTVSGAGQILTDPATNSLPAGSWLKLKALPDPGQLFLGWEGDLRGLGPEVTLAMDRVWSFRARFTDLVSMSAAPDFSDPRFVDLRIQSEQNRTFLLESQTDTGHWQPLVLVTNNLGTAVVRQPVDFGEGRRWYRLSQP